MDQIYSYDLRMISLDMLTQAVARLERAHAAGAKHACVLRVTRLNVVRNVGLENGGFIADSADPFPVKAPKHFHLDLLV